MREEALKASRSGAKSIILENTIEKLTARQSVSPFLSFDTTWICFSVLFDFDKVKYFTVGQNVKSFTVVNDEISRFARCEIKFVPLYAVGIFHIAKQYFISKIFHSFRKERISLKKALAEASAFFLAVTNY